jgi:hypothetical protein
MLRSVLIVLGIGVIVWAPWMDTGSGRVAIDTALEAFGPVSSVCYDSENDVLFEGLAVRWYPLGRMVHTCEADYVVWLWGDVKELGGLYKQADDIQRVQSKPLTCEDVVRRQESRLATSTDNTIEYYEGDVAETPNYSLHPEAEEYDRLLTAALKKGPTFAGKFTVAEWNCGVNCKRYTILDIATGLVLAHELEAEYGAAYAVDTTLFVTNPIESLPELGLDDYEAESQALSLARLPRTYYRLTSDALSGTQYMVQLCVESAATGYVAVEDERLGIVE